MALHRLWEINKKHNRIYAYKNKQTKQSNNKGRELFKLLIMPQKYPM